MTRRVVVTGVGMVNPMGHDVETVWKGLREGASGVSYTTIFDASNFPTKISAEVKDWDDTVLTHVPIPPNGLLGLAATTARFPQMACSMSGLGCATIISPCWGIWRLDRRANSTLIVSV